MTNSQHPQWIKDEWSRIAERRQRAFGDPLQQPDRADRDPPSAATEPKNLLGLALSGGGIRSALYNDGFLQGLSHRGLLRYVDYMCSVSGGGYIAGHLISQSNDSTDPSQPSFHNDPVRRSLGRDPDTGKVESRRLSGIGGYLSRTFEFLPAYLWSFLFSFTFYIGIVGISATLAALFWRSFDDLDFRSLYYQALGLGAGDELLIAFIPAIVLVILAIAVEACLSTFRLFHGFDKPSSRKLHLFLRKAFLLLITLAMMTSIAIFLGNGKTNVRGNASGNVFLNHYAQYFAISAGIIQILVFLGRDRLFRSERAESKQWQKYLQQTVTTVVLLFLTFSMVHWMGREDISGYTSARDPHLVRGDVINWYFFDQLVRDFSDTDEELPAAEDLSGRAPQFITPDSRWFATLASSRTDMFGLDTLSDKDFSHPSSPLQQPLDPPNEKKLPEELETVWSLPQRLWGACIAYGLAMFADRSDAGTAETGVNQADSDTTSMAKTAARDPQTAWNSPKASVFHYVDGALDELRERQKKQNALLRIFNRRMEKLALTRHLIDNFQQPDNPELSIAVLKQLSDHFKSTSAEITTSQQQQLFNLVRRLDFADDNEHSNVAPSQNVTSSESEKSSERLTTALANRLLLEAMFPGAIQQYDVPSTMVVPPHDQRTRRRWLVFWMIVALVGTIGGLGPYRIATVFQFYRQQLSSNFLVATHDPSRAFGEKELDELNPTADGLPYPLILAATLEPSTSNGSYKVKARPFVFSPLYSGRFDEADSVIPSSQLSFSMKPENPGVTLGDAITLSGAAVTPLMTGNRWLSVILDFFNTGIGQRVRRLDRTGREKAKELKVPFLLSILASIVVAIATWTLVGLTWAPSMLAGTLSWLLAYCVIVRVGSPGLIRSLVLPSKGEGRDSCGAKTRVDRSFYIADGGYCDYLGVSELLRRRCEVIVVSDAGANIGNDALGTLARMCESAAEEMGIRFLDLDHEAPIDFGRLEVTDQRLVHQPFLCMRIRYPESDRKEGLLFYCQMSITESDPIEIQHIRNLFPSFPDEPTVNQFYTETQVAAYRSLGYHIANRLCNELQPWQWAMGQRTIGQPVAEPQPKPTKSNAKRRDAKHRKAKKQIPLANTKADQFLHSLLTGAADPSSQTIEQSSVGDGQPLFRVLIERLRTAYYLACYEELSYRKDDIFSEAIWPSCTFAFPTFRTSVEDVLDSKRPDGDLADRWLRQYECSADLRSAYRTAVIGDINSLDIGNDCLCSVLWSAINVILKPQSWDQKEHLLAAHLTNLGAACQEIHRGRPHSAFQVGGRDKLIQLCGSISRVISRTLKEQTENNAGATLVIGLDRLMVELIELERSVFQGSEHVTTISFAQCMSAMWGSMSRSNSDQEEPAADVVDGLLEAFRVPTMTNGQTQESTGSRKSPELRVAELRSQLDQGLKHTRLQLVRDALAKSWYLGYFTGSEMQNAFDFPAAEDAEKVMEESTKPAAR